jgi:recombinational DNA repair protein (RecF pathway)
MQQHGLCSPKDGHKLCPKHVETEVDNKHLNVASCWFSLSSQFAHDARSQESKESKEFMKIHFFCYTDILTTQKILLMIA